MVWRNILDFGELQGELPILPVVTFFCNKTKTESFLENHKHTFLDIDRNFPKTKFSKNLI